MSVLFSSLTTTTTKTKERALTLSTIIIIIIKNKNTIFEIYIKIIKYFKSRFN